MMGRQEPYELRDSRTDLWGPRGEIPLGYPAIPMGIIDAYLISVQDSFFILNPCIQGLQPLIFNLPFPRVTP